MQRGNERRATAARIRHQFRRGARHGAKRIALLLGALIYLSGCEDLNLSNTEPSPLPQKPSEPLIAVPRPQDLQLVRLGRVVLLGGVIDRENTAIWKGILDAAALRERRDPATGATSLASGSLPRVGVITAAGWDHDQAWRGAMAGFERWGEPGIATDLDITTQTAELANDAGRAARIDALGGVHFTGGDQSNIVRVFRPNGKDTQCLAAFRRILEAGGVMSGSSAGASCMSDPMFRWGSSEGALKDGVTGKQRVGVGLGQGLGLLNWGLVDQHFLKKGRFGRLAVALDAAGLRHGFGIDENRGLVCDLFSGNARAIGGPMGVVVIENPAGERRVADGATTAMLAGDVARRKTEWRGLRLSLLGEGDSYNEERAEVKPGLTHTDRVTLDGPERIDHPGSAWADSALKKALVRMAAEKARGVRMDAESHWVELTADEHSQVFRAAGTKTPDLLFVKLRLDIVPKSRETASLRTTATD